jgi:hypothetical protein
MKAPYEQTLRAVDRWDSESSAMLPTLCGLRWVRGRKAWYSVEAWNAELSFLLETKLAELRALDIPCEATKGWRGARGIAIPSKFVKKIFGEQ